MNWPLLQNSLLVSGATTLLAMAFGFMAALWLTSVGRRWRNIGLALAVAVNLGAGLFFCLASVGCQRTLAHFLKLEHPGVESHVQAENADLIGVVFDNN
jgi:ABC-type spermidine/putrescine transport system permease subunit II